MPNHLIWFRADLRLHDNLALYAACNQKNARVLALFIATPDQWQHHGIAPRQISYMLMHLNVLRKELAKKGIPLLYTQVSDFDKQVIKVNEICVQYNITHLFYNYQYEFNERKRDKQIENNLSKKVVCHGFDDSVILAPGSIMTNKNKMYKVFAPFKKAWIKHLKEKLPQCVAAPETRDSVLDDVDDIVLNYHYQELDIKLFPSSEKEAITKLNQFCERGIEKYQEQRDFPAADSTSKLSACLTLGILSPRQCLHSLIREQPDLLNSDDSRALWLNELIWREFYRHLMTYYTNICKHIPFIDWTSNVKWIKDEVKLIAWKQGRTGYPIVDAAMRQLNTIGWMNNRLRMITASFLVKDLLIDWRIGERYFISQLVDGDLAANNGGWQWSASTGTDSVPYFRILNPTIQSQKFDADGNFIRRWLPELSKVPNKAIHDPYKWAIKSGIKLDYPFPIVDHQQARATTLAAYKVAYKAKNHD